ncbi:transposase family protein [Streptomyces sp. NPDC003027]
MDEVVIQLEEVLLEEVLLAAVEGIDLVAVGVTEEGIRLDAQSTTGGASCPGCGQWSTRVHGSYLRFPHDLPTAGQRMVLPFRR